jgi:MbtH protein
MPMSHAEDDNIMYRVVTNEDEQYSIWFVDRELPAGWYEAGPTGSKRECLEYIDFVWTDMQPRSVRRFMEEEGSI